MIEQCTKYIKKKGLRLTKQRIKLVQEIAQMNQHFDVDLLISVMKKKKINISRATVYRTLPILQECGVIREVTQLDNKVYYENNYNKKHHDHMICLNCGRIIEFFDNDIERLQDKICAKSCFKPEKHRLIIYGLCEDCGGGKND
ncbi:transcriptional repressor [bacterium]|nr:transcriptional repressor [bacterium]